MEIVAACLLLAVLAFALPSLVLGRVRTGRLSADQAKACPLCGIPTDADAGSCHVCDYQFPEAPMANAA
jgi:hypothetical protein